MQRTRRRQWGALTLASALAVALPITVAHQDASAANETIVSTGVAGHPYDVVGAPPGYGVILGQSDDGEYPKVWVRRDDGGVVDLGEGFQPEFWLGDGDDALLVGTVSERFGSDLNSDGDFYDQLLATSRNGSTFLPLHGHLISGNYSSLYCIFRLSADLAIACSMERSASVDFNSDGDMEDVEISLLHSDGTIERHGYFVENAGNTLPRSNTVLPDGSISIGPLRVFPNGSVTNTGLVVPDGEVIGLVGTGRLIRVPFVGGQSLTFKPPTGPSVPIDSSATPLQMGSSLWVQTTSAGLCRLSQNGVASCFGVTAELLVRFFPLGDDSALFVGTPLASPTGPAHAYLVKAGQGAVEIPLASSDIELVDLGAGGAIVITRFANPTRVVHVTSAGTVDLPIANDWPNVVSLHDGRALVNVRETPHGPDLNHDGDQNDSVTHLMTDGALENLGVIASLERDLTRHLPRAIGLAGRAALFPIDEIYTGDRTGDGDTLDSVISLFDGANVVSLGLAIGKLGTYGSIYPSLVDIGDDVALVSVWERGQGSDLNGNGVLEDLMTFSVAFETRPPGTPPPSPPPPPPGPPSYEPLVPTRLLDTRVDGPQVGYVGSKPVAGQIIEVQAPSGATAIAMSVTGLNSVEPGFVTVYPCGEPIPTASSLNLTPGLITPNLVLSKVGAGGRVCIFTQRSADLIADLAGVFETGSPYVPLTPVRLLDTRPDGPQVGYSGAKPSTGQTIVVDVPAGASAVVMNVTGLDAEQDGYVTVYPCGDARPWVSNVNLTPGLITPNLVIATVGANHQVCIFTQRSANLLADLTGTIPTGSMYTPVMPKRVLDTRVFSQIGYAGPKPVAGQTIAVQAPVGARAVVLNLIGLESNEDGFVTVYPCGGQIPTASNLNLSPGHVSSNLSIATVGANGSVCIFTQRSANVVADLLGTFPS